MCGQNPELQDDGGHNENNDSQSNQAISFSETGSSDASHLLIETDAFSNLDDEGKITAGFWIHLDEDHPVSNNEHTILKVYDYNDSTSQEVTSGGFEDTYNKSAGDTTGVIHSMRTLLTLTVPLPRKYNRPLGPCTSGSHLTETKASADDGFQITVGQETVIAGCAQNAWNNWRNVTNGWTHWRFGDPMDAAGFELDDFRIFNTILKQLLTTSLTDSPLIPIGPPLLMIHPMPFFFRRSGASPRARFRFKQQNLRQRCSGRIGSGDSRQRSSGRKVPSAETVRFLFVGPPAWAPSEQYQS